MGVAKITISLPQELVDEVDELARNRDTSRSLLIREAAAGYLSAARQEAAEALRRERETSAWEALETLRNLPEVDTRSSADIIAELRSETGSEREDCGT